jgi:hypothetical protein
MVYMLGGDTWHGIHVTFERRINISSYQENFYEELERHVKEGSGNRQLSP